jgi:hypothetical protein
MLKGSECDCESKKNFYFQQLVESHMKLEKGSKENDSNLINRGIAEYSKAITEYLEYFKTESGETEKVAS